MRRPDKSPEPERLRDARKKAIVGWLHIGAGQQCVGNIFGNFATWDDVPAGAALAVHLLQGAAGTHQVGSLQDSFDFQRWNHDAPPKKKGAAPFEPTPIPC
jgi:hypothetical protein